MSCGFETLDAAYVLGSLAPAERAEYERHLRTCDACATAVRELAGLPGLLGRVPAEVLEDPVVPQPVPETLLPGLVAAAEKRQRRRTFRTALLAAAAVAVIAAGSAVVAGSLADDDDPPVSSPDPSVVDTTAPPERMEPVGRGNTSDGWVSLTPLANGGTRVNLTCTYRSDYGGAHDYELVTYARNGEKEIKTFSAVTGAEEGVKDYVAFDIDDIEKVVVEGGYGPVLLLNR